MRKVYIVVVATDYEGDEILDVFGTEVKAQKFIKIKAESDGYTKDKYGHWSYYGQTLLILEYQVK